jgi:hypothetical protein
MKITEVTIKLGADEYYRVRITRGEATTPVGTAYINLHLALEAAKLAISAPTDNPNLDTKNGRWF